MMFMDSQKTGKNPPVRQTESMWSDVGIHAKGDDTRQSWPENSEARQVCSRAELLGMKGIRAYSVRPVVRICPQVFQRSVGRRHERNPCKNFS